MRCVYYYDRKETNPGEQDFLPRPVVKLFFLEHPRCSHLQHLSHFKISNSSHSNLFVSRLNHYGNAWFLIGRSLQSITPRFNSNLIAADLFLHYHVDRQRAIPYSLRIAEHIIIDQFRNRPLIEFVSYLVIDVKTRIRFIGYYPVMESGFGTFG